MKIKNTSRTKYDKKRKILKNKKLIISTLKTKLKYNSKYKNKFSNKIKKITQKRKNNKKNSKKMLKKGGEIIKIAQGTHGSIYYNTEIPNIVFKEFNNETTFNQSLCERIISNNSSLCHKINYEFLIQKTIGEKFLEQSLNIYVPQVYNFHNDKEKNKCMYEMDRIYPLYENEKELTIIDMTNYSYNSTITGLGIFRGYGTIEKELNDCGFDNLSLSYEIGKMFSLLHFVLLLDGYDCELILGKDKNNNTKLFLIDYDKVSCFNFEINTILHRKIDENTVETKNITNINKLSLFLFYSIVSMSLLPTDDTMKTKFIEGYTSYLNYGDDFMKEEEINVKTEVYNMILSFIESYTV